MKLLKMAVLLLASLCFLVTCTGCKSTSGSAGISKMVITNRKEVDQKWPPPMTHFAAGETLLVRVIGCEGRHFTLQMLNQLTGETLLSRTELFPIHSIELGQEHMAYGRVMGDRSSVPALMNVTPINIRRSQYILPLKGLPAGSYEVHLLIEGQLVETAAFTVSQ